MSSCDDKDEEFELRVMENGGYTDEDINKSKLIDLVQHFAQTTFKTNDNNPIVSIFNITHICNHQLKNVKGPIRILSLSDNHFSSFHNFHYFQSGIDVC